MNEKLYIIKKYAEGIVVALFGAAYRRSNREYQFGCLNIIYSTGSITISNDKRSFLLSKQYFWDSYIYAQESDVYEFENDEAAILAAEVL